MQRRSFLASLFAAPAVPVVAKAIAAAPTPPATPAIPQQPELLCFIAGRLQRMKAETVVLEYRIERGASVSFTLGRITENHYALRPYCPNPYDEVRIVERGTGHLLFCGKITQINEEMLPGIGNRKVSIQATDRDLYLKVSQCKCYMCDATKGNDVRNGL